MAGRTHIPTNSSALIAMIADELKILNLHACFEFRLQHSEISCLLVCKEFTSKEDIAIVLISQCVANMIRFLVDSYNKPIPAILEIPSKDHPYDPAHDSVLSRVKYLFSTESVASGRRSICLNVSQFML
ncbi:V-type proton ATPase subunit F [Quillaja saponaria]|uniref:V-type proton ATPase subunit F n=1 Tax=Quillaja saponaria TaxID=32244 RepID=A0AAD7QB27_QUISA|nr:V-type proton ATPase subunit F [Quillaja saponaria]